ncbi:MAG: XdhC family protein [Chthoniobacterales bacterium]
MPRKAMSDILDELLASRRAGRPCVLATVAATSGSVPRHPGAKMIIYADGSISGTVGGGKFESLVMAEALACLARHEPLLKTWPLREDQPDSFGAICGGEVTVLLEPQAPAHALLIVGGGHCAQAIAKLAAECGFHVTVVEDRDDILSQCTAAHQRLAEPAASVISSRDWTGSDAIVIVSRHYDIDREALAAALNKGGMGYTGMIGSRRKVLQVYDQLKASGITADQLATVYAPLGLDIGADSPAEIAVSVLAEILLVLRHKSGHPLKL